MTTPWEPPQYDEIRIRPGYTDWLCSRCGTLVSDFIVHNQHHKALDDLKNGIIAISQILVPGLPAGMMLQPQPAIKISFAPSAKDEGDPK